MADPSVRCLVLDAMGVLFAAADDVAELLVPFIRSKGGQRDASAIEAAYLEASLGGLDADGFWRRVGLDPAVEREYLAQHRVGAGTLKFLNDARGAGLPVWCLSNDVGRWSQQLRTTLGIEPLLDGAVISSDVGARKPDRRIYDELVAATGFEPSALLFVDDRMSNVNAAAELGIRAVHFAETYGYSQLAAELFGIVR